MDIETLDLTCFQPTDTRAYAPRSFAGHADDMLSLLVDRPRPRFDDPRMLWKPFDKMAKRDSRPEHGFSIHCLFDVADTGRRPRR